MSQYFGELTKRMEQFREEVLTSKPKVCAERAVYTTESYKANLDQPAVLKRAYMLENVLKKMSIFIEKDTLIVGNQASANRAAPIFPRVCDGLGCKGTG